MRRYEPESIGDLLRRAIEENQSAFRYDEISAIRAWPKVVGESIASRTMRPFIKGGVMTVRVPSAPLRQELNMMRSMIARAINAEISKEIVKEIRFH